MENEPKMDQSWTTNGPILDKNVLKMVRNKNE